MGYSLQLAARDLLYVPSHNQYSTAYYFYTSHRDLAEKKKRKLNGFTMRGWSDNPSHHEQMLHHKGLFCSNLRVNLTICHHQKCQILHPTVASPAQLLSHFSVCLTFCWDQKTPVIIQSRLWDEHSLRLYICGSQYNSKNSKLAIL